MSENITGWPLNWCSTYIVSAAFMSVSQATTNPSSFHKAIGRQGAR